MLHGSTPFLRLHPIVLKHVSDQLEADAEIALDKMSSPVSMSSIVAVRGVLNLIEL